MTLVVFAETLGTADRDLSVERAILGAEIELVHYACDGNEDRLMLACRDADIVLTDYAPFTNKVIEGLRRCRMISVAATGFSSIDVQAAKHAAVSVCAIDEYCTDEVADHVMLLILALCRRLPEYHDQVQREHRWQFDSLSGLACLRDMTLGIVGYGKIGQAVARRAAGFGTTIIAHDPAADDTAAAHSTIRHCDLRTLFAESDIVSLNCALSASNRHIIDANALQQMKKRPLLINCGRGGLVDEEALINALDSGQIAGAGLDVLNDETPDLLASQLTGRSNVILTPHVAFYSDASMLENRRVSAANIRHFLDGEHGYVRRYVFHAEG